MEMSGISVFGGISGGGGDTLHMNSHVTELTFNCPERGWLCEERRPGGHAVAWHAGLALTNSHLVLAGGRGELGVSKAVYTSMDHKHWTLVDQLEPGRDQSASIVLPDLWRQTVPSC